MNASFARVRSISLAVPVLAAGSAALTFALASPFGNYLASAFAQGWLAVYLDGAAFRALCL